MGGPLQKRQRGPLHLQARGPQPESSPHFWQAKSRGSWAPRSPSDPTTGRYFGQLTTLSYQGASRHGQNLERAAWRLFFLDRPVPDLAKCWEISSKLRGWLRAATAPPPGRPPPRNLTPPDPQRAKGSACPRVRGCMASRGGGRAPATRPQAKRLGRGRAPSRSLPPLPTHGDPQCTKAPM